MVLRACLTLAWPFYAQGNYGYLQKYLEAELGCSPNGSVDGLLLDLGMSSMQASILCFRVQQR